MAHRTSGSTRNQCVEHLLLFTVDTKLMKLTSTMIDYAASSMCDQICKFLTFVMKSLSAKYVSHVRFTAI